MGTSSKGLLWSPGLWWLFRSPPILDECLGLPWALTGARFQSEDAEEGAGDDVQAVEGSLPVQVVLVGVHDRDSEQQQQLHRHLGGAAMSRDGGPPRQGTPGDAP